MSGRSAFFRTEGSLRSPGSRLNTEPDRGDQPQSFLELCRGCGTEPHYVWVGQSPCMSGTTTLSGWDTTRNFVTPVDALVGDDTEVLSDFSYLTQRDIEACRAFDAAKSP